MHTLAEVAEGEPNWSGCFITRREDPDSLDLPDEPELFLMLGCNDSQELNVQSI